MDQGVDQKSHEVFAMGEINTSLVTKPWARRVLYGCLFMVALLVLLDYVFTWYELIDDSSIPKLTNIAREESIPTWFAAIQALFVGLTVFAIVAVLRVRKAPRKTLIGWSVIGCFFTWMSVDDTAVFHERVGSALGRAFRHEEGTPEALQSFFDLNTYSWQLFLAPLWAAMGVFILVFLWRHLRRFGLHPRLILGLGLYATAVSIDAVEGIDDYEGYEEYYDYLAATWGVEDYTVSHYAKVLEECLEMLGTMTFFYTFLLYLSYVSDGMKLSLRTEQSGSGKA